MQKLCEAVVIRVIKWEGNADTEEHGMPLPNVISGASVLITGSRLVAGTDRKEYKKAKKPYECIEC